MLSPLPEAFWPSQEGPSADKLQPFQEKLLLCLTKRCPRRDKVPPASCRVQILLALDVETP